MSSIDQNEPADTDRTSNQLQIRVMEVIKVIRPTATVIGFGTIFFSIGIAMGLAATLIF